MQQILHKGLQRILWNAEKKAQFGYFEEINDVVIFTFDGTTIINFKKIVRQKGSLRNENYHQQMKTDIGPWNIGAEKSNDIILLLLSFCYHINTWIGLCGEHNFVHPWIDLIDCV